MAIGRIGGSDNYYQYRNTMNQLRTGQTTRTTHSYTRDYLNSTTQKSNSTNSNKNSATQKDSMKGTTGFLKSYNSSMSDLMTSANKLRKTNSSSVLNEQTVKSSDSEVVSASKRYNFGRVSSDKLSVNVKQLASAQTNESKAVNSKELASQDASLSIVTSNGNEAFHVSAFNEKGEQKTNKQMFTDLAKEINSKKDLGVTASVVEKDGKSTLKLTGQNTGEKHSFLVNGDFAEQQGMTQATSAAQDAKYSVKKEDGTERDYTSASNDISLDNGKIAATLKKTGEATIGAGMDTGKVTSSVQDLVDSYNSSLKVLNDNAGRGTGVIRQLGNMLNGPAPERSMELIGISVNKDGTLKLDKDKLASSLEKDPSLTKDIIGGTAGLAQGAFEDARSGLTINSGSLINNDMQDMYEQSFDDPIQYMAMFSKRGSFNMSNFTTLGMIVNMWA